MPCDPPPPPLSRADHATLPLPCLSAAFVAQLTASASFSAIRRSKLFKIMDTNQVRQQHNKERQAFLL